MHRHLLLLWLVGLLVTPALAQSPEQIVTTFYGDYRYALEAAPGQWMATLVKRQAHHLEPALSDRLLRLANGDPNKGEPFLDFDPFSASQMGMEEFNVGTSQVKQGLTYVPVSMRLAGEPGAQKVRLHFVLRPDVGGAWRIANVVYPAENGMASWDLKGYLVETFP
jgi:hypothetical protein